MEPDLSTLWDYDTWQDADGFHARLKRHLSAGAIRHRCLQKLRADTALELMQEAVRNRVRVWLWESTPRTTRAQWHEIGDPR